MQSEETRQSDDEECVYLKLEDLDNICRLCLDQGPLLSLSMLQSCIDIEDLSFIEMKLEDELPKNVCGDCFNELQKIALFVGKCKMSQEFLRQVKTECAKLNVDDSLGMEIGTSEEVIEIKPQEIVMVPFDTVITTEVDGVQMFVAGNNAETKSSLAVDSCDYEICDRCGESVATLSSHYKQSRKCAPTNRNCTICKLSFATRQMLNNHVAANHRNVAPTTAFRCHLCPSMFKYKVNLRRHLLTHENGKCFTCEMCGKGYTTKIQLQDHMNSHTGNKPFACRYCDKKFGLRSGRSAHQIKHENESLMMGVEKVSVCNAPASCGVCQKQFVHNRALKLHMRSHDENKIYQCAICRKQFENVRQLRHHSELHAEQKPYSCPLCEKRFMSRDHLTVHMRVHTGERPFVCSVCGNAFYQMTHLTYHMLTHKGEKSFKCKFCEKAFALKGNLTVHQRLHTGEKPFLCHVCNKGFYDSSSRKKHVRLHHGEEEVKNIRDFSTECVR